MIGTVYNIVCYGKKFKPLGIIFFELHQNNIYRYFWFKYPISSKCVHDEISIKKSYTYVDDRINCSTIKCIIIVKSIHSSLHSEYKTTKNFYSYFKDGLKLYFYSIEIFSFQ